MENFIKASSGNVYRDLEFSNAGAMKMKAEIVSMIGSTITEKNIPVEFVANLAGITGEMLESILCGHFREIDYSQLLYILSMLGKDIEIKISPSTEKYGKVVVA